ncbi:sialic acid synthase [Drosophila pseudoobscura]|uniref:N-acetylneuraminate-9-phosphate synthase n=1 Tax=Drosophila pseudoobscura pseudoobscura TaxID=46245 RepID=A0A6I8UN26_DROPS|nr:sialic acid synthase [Drosophila pseudoobscura]
MMLVDILEKKIDDSVYIIAEIGQNHQGCLELAKTMILKAKEAGCHCVKFQKSDLPAKFTRSALAREYVSENAWGKTYGEHKEYLEFSRDQYQELQAYSRQLNVDFTASAMDELSLDFLADLKVPFIKIGSGDANNFPLLKKAAGLGVPLVISTGMQTIQTVEKIVKIMAEAGKIDYALMHCVSAYPTPPKDCNLRLISMLKNRFPNVVIGYSGHELGVAITQAAVLLGARIVERHFTLDKNQKGSDHRCSLETHEFKSLIAAIQRFKLTKLPFDPDAIISMLGGDQELAEALQYNGEKKVLACELPCRNKLGKSIVAARTLHKGLKLQLTDLAIKVSEPNGLPAEAYFDIVGKELTDTVYEDEPIAGNMVKL